MNIKTLTFDVFGTVVDWRSGVARSAEAYLKPKGFDLDWGAFADGWRSGYVPAILSVVEGKRPWATFETLHREILDGMVGKFGLEGLGENDREALNAGWRQLDPWPDVTAGMTRLKAKFPLVSLSNGGVAQMIALARRGGLPWDAILGAQISGSYKPDPKLYLDAAHLLDCRPDEVMMVAAHPSDLRAAAGCGLRTAYVHRAHEYGAHSEKPRPDAGAFDIHAEDFGDLADQLGC